MCIPIYLNTDFEVCFILQRVETDKASGIVSNTSFDALLTVGYSRHPLLFLVAEHLR